MSAATLPVETGTDNEVLREKSVPVKFVDKKIKNLLQKMHATVRKENGIGLAAPQVGQNVRVIVAQISGTFLSMVNPEILEFSQACELSEEGCLSLPGEWGMVSRPKEVLLRFLDERGQQQMLKLQQLDARVVQHEIDHLDGVLFVDRVQEKILAAGEMRL